MQQETDLSKIGEPKPNELFDKGLQLGRLLEAQIDEYIEKHGDIEAHVILLACDYVIKHWKERLGAMNEHYGSYYGKLKETIKEIGVSVHEPLTNDGIESRNFEVPKNV